MGYIFYIMGKSSSGKDSLYKSIKEKMPELQGITLYTTRPIRQGEVDGQDYWFISEEKCSQLEEQGKIIELRAYNTVHGIWKYFTVDDGQIDLMKASYFMIGTLESYQNIKKYYTQDVMVPIYIEVEDGIRLSRALKREKAQEEPKYKELCRRFLADSEDFSEEKLVEAGITGRFFNLHFERCLEEILLFIRTKV